jgi:hypothetical protein
MERMWRQVLLEAMLPAGESRLPSLGSLDLEPFWERFDQSAPWTLRAGFRLALWVLTWLPLVSLRFRRPLFGLSPAGRDEFLRRKAASRYYVMRQLVETIKLVATLAYFHDERPRRFFEGERR